MLSLTVDMRLSRIRSAALIHQVKAKVSHNAFGRVAVIVLDVHPLSVCC
jgi:hypothetical protein